MTTATKRMAMLSVATSIVTLLLKMAAYLLTGSISLFSDAAESLVNLTAGLVALGAITFASQPPDEEHAYGHDKAEYFSSGLEGGLIVIAAVSIIYLAVQRFIHPVPLEQLGWGLVMTLIASALNFITARLMLKVAKEHDSITLEADAKHLLTDVWTSVGVVSGLMVIVFTPPRWQILDPIVAILVALNIIRTGVQLIRRSLDGLLDAALPAEELKQIESMILKQIPSETSFKDLRTRKSGPRRFIEFSLLLPGQSSVERAHDLCDCIEEEIYKCFPKASVTIHIEPNEN